MTRTALAWVSWSSGKDSALALAKARRDPAIEVVGLLTTVNADADRVAMHAVRRELLQAQADRLDLDLHVVEIPEGCTEAAYAAKMRDAMARAESEGVSHIVFGDLFLEDVRRYREEKLAECGLTPLFPIWGRPTPSLAREMLSAGIRAVVTCLDSRHLLERFIGREFDADFLAELPSSIDPCGENGEFHTFTWDGPGFSSPIPIEVGTTVRHDPFVFCDLTFRTRVDA